jgi:hypothetical protein
MSALVKPLYVTGVEPLKQRLMLGGIFKMHDQVGYPIDCCIEEAKERGFDIDWLEALCDCWLNDCLKFDSFCRQIESQTNLQLKTKFSMTGACVLAKFPKMKNTNNPINTVCKYIMAKKQRGRW